MNASGELPVWIIVGANWECEVGLDEKHAEFDIELQIEEACTRAIEAVKGFNPYNLELKMDDGVEIPTLGPLTLFYLKNSDGPKVGNFEFTHILLANGGYYKESMAMEKVAVEQLDKIQQDLGSDEKAQAKLKNFKKDGETPDDKKSD